MHLRHRVQLIFLALALIVVADVGLDRYLVAERDQHRRDVRTRWEPARNAAAELLFGLVDQETGERGYLITGEDEFLEPYREGGRRVDRALEDLERLVGDQPDIEAQLQRAGDRVSAWRQLGAAFEIDARRGDRPGAVEELVSTGTSKALFDEARVEIADLRSSVIRRLERQEEMVDRLESRISTVRVASALLALAIVVGGGWLLRRWMGRPLVQLAEAARTVAGGKLDHQIPEPGPPELAGLGRDVEAMRRRILAEVDEATRARSSLAERGMIVLTLRDELAPGSVELPPGLRVATRFRPAETIVAGDWYEVRRCGASEVTFVLADVSGHGPTAGIFALKTKQLVQIALEQDLRPAQAWAWVAERLGDTGDQFLSGVIGRMDAATGVVTYASAGHPPLLLRAADGVVTLAPNGTIVGAVTGSWGETSATVGPGSCVIAYSDGLLEVQDRGGRWAELDELRAFLADARCDDVEQVADVCFAFHDRHDGGQRSDDVTVVVVGAGTDP